MGLNMICNYGCGQEAKFQMSNKKWCCGEFYTKCPELRKKNTSIKGRKLPERTLNHRLKISKSLKGKKPKEESLKRRSITMKRWWENHPEKKEQQKEWMKNGWALYMNFFHIEERKEKQRQYMLNGGSVHASSFIKNPSKPQVELYNRVKEIYNSSVLNYPFYPLNYSLDVAIPDLKIWFESDGPYWHQDKELDLKRQKRIEELGWKVIRYSADHIKDVPLKEQIIKDIENILN